MRHLSRSIVMAAVIVTLFMFAGRTQTAHAECALASATNPPTTVFNVNMIAGHTYKYVSSGATNQTILFPSWDYTGPEPFPVDDNSTATVFDTSINCYSLATLSPIGHFQVTKVTNALGTFPPACPETVKFNGSISTNGAGAVTYEWDSSQGMAVDGVHILIFSGTGTQDVHLSLTYHKAYSGWATLHVIHPNLLYSNQVNFSGTCP